MEKTSVIVTAAFLAVLASAAAKTFADERKQIGTVMVEPVYRDQIRSTDGFTLRGELSRLFTAPVWEKFREENREKITPTKDEMAAVVGYFRKRRRELLAGEHGDLLRKQLTEVTKELAAHDLPDDKLAALKLRKQSLEDSLDPHDKSVAGAAALTLRNWKVQRLLYDRYGGGRIVWQQFGVEAFDATHAFLREREMAGDFSITDPALRNEFYVYWTNEKMHGSFLTSDEERIRNTFLEPPWIGSANDTTDAPPELRKWLQPQQWRRDTEGPIIRLGETGEFDDTHLLAPCVARIGGEYRLWYSGSTGSVAERVFALGMATSKDGCVFQKHSANPVYRFGNGKHSILTATLLRNPDGSVLREDGKLRMWFSSTHFSSGAGHHALHETTSADGVTWNKPSEPLLDHVYAPTILKESGEYRMWYTDVSSEPWTMRLATSRDGRRWQVHSDPVLKPEAKWEKSRLFYPTVLKADGVYLMWYGSYWNERPNTTAIGLAASLDGFRWYRNPRNPVLRPDPNCPWESHYTTSQSVMRNEDGSFRIWYASRKKPPFVNKYFAINTAIWAGPEEADGRHASLPPGRQTTACRGATTFASLGHKSQGIDVENADERVDVGNDLQSTPATPIANGNMVVYWKESAATTDPPHVLIHFHGAPERVRKAYLRSQLDVVLVVVNFRGLSSAYSTPFASDATLFSEILRRSRVAICDDGNKGDVGDWDCISLSCFSAGYGAVREILKTPAEFDRIHAIVAADSIYAGLQAGQLERQVNQEQMRDFLRFASLAAEGKKSFVLSHSALATPYASTAETADYLLESLMIDRKPDSRMSLPTLRQATSAARRGFVVLGFDGESGPDHMQHLHHIDLFWQRLLTEAHTKARRHQED